MEMEKLRHGTLGAPLLAGLVILPLLSGCNSQSFALDDGIPNTPPPAVIVQNKNAPAPGPLAVRNTGAYPTFDPTLTAAAEQIEDDDYHKAEPRLASPCGWPPRPRPGGRGQTGSGPTSGTRQHSVDR